MVIYGLQIHTNQPDMVAKVIFRYLFAVAAGCASELCRLWLKQWAHIWLPTCQRSLIGFMFLVSLGSGRMLACDCRSPAIPVALERADVVFMGTAVKVQDLGKETFGPSHRIVVMFEVKTFWKGPVQRTTVMYTRINTSDCDGFLSLEQGKQYIVYGYKKRNLNFRDVAPDANEVLGTWVCSRTRELRFAEQDTRALGDGKSPK